MTRDVIRGLSRVIDRVSLKLWLLIFIYSQIVTIAMNMMYCIVNDSGDSSVGEWLLLMLLVVGKQHALRDTVTLVTDKCHVPVVY